MTMDVSQAMAARRSVRGFSQDSVPRDVLTDIFGRAQATPSWCNIQPWRVWVTSGDGTKRVADAMLHAAQNEVPTPEYPFPMEYPAPYDRHRKECGKALYEAMGVARDDKAGRMDAWLRNFTGFGAPHLAFVGLDRRFGIYAALDLGCWLQSVMLLSTERGVSTCPQASLATYPGAVRSLLGMPEDVGLLCGLAIGYEDTAVAANNCRTTREPLASNLIWVD